MDDKRIEFYYSACDIYNFLVDVTFPCWFLWYAW